MAHRRPITFLASAAVIPLAALAVAACGGGGAATAASPPKTSKAPTTPPTMVRVADSRLGRILVNSTGRTLYLFKADVGTTSACSGACATAWPPLLTTGNPTAGTGLTASKLGTITRSNGGKQVTYNGHPLYLFIKDTQPGDTNGQGVTAFGAPWFALNPTGNEISSRPAAAAPPAANPQPAPKPTQPAAPPATTPAPKPTSPPAATPPASNGIPQNGGGDDDSDNHGAPSDGDGNI